MDELRELCRTGKDVKLQDTSVWEQEDPSLLATAKQILEEHSYEQDPSDQSLFVQSGKLRLDSVQYSVLETGSSSLILPGSVPKVNYSSPPTADTHRSRSHPESSSPASSKSGRKLPKASMPHDDGSWRPCHCIQIDTRVSDVVNQLRIAVPASLQHSCREQRVAMTLVIQPTVRTTPANLDVSLRIKTLFVGVLTADVIKSETALGFYPVRYKLLIEPELGDPRAVAVPLYTSRADQGGGSGRGSTTTRITDTKIGAQIGFGPVTLSGERSWGAEIEKSSEREMVRAGDDLMEVTGSTAVFEWMLLRWSHNGKSYNSKNPHSGLNWTTKSLKAPFPGGNTGARVESFPDVMWHLHPSMRSKFPLKFKLQLEVEMHILWFAGKSRLFRVAEWTREAFQFCHQFQVSDGVKSAV